MSTDLTFITNEPGKSLRDRFGVLVGKDTRFAAKQRHAEADTSALERELDELVYALYGLTPEEKALVQAASVSTPARQVPAAK